MRSRRELWEVQEAYWAARRRGFTNTAASRLVGVHRRQGRRWAERIEAAGEPIPRARSGSPRYLSLTEREQIADGIAQGRSLRAIAAVVGRSASTVSREVAGNRDPATGRYGPFTADRLAVVRACRPKARKVELHPPLWRFVRARLRQRWSPAQISAVLAEQFGEDKRMQASPETIYQAIYVQARGELRREMVRALRTGRAMRRPQRRDDARRTRYVEPGLMISHRPAEAADRAVPGHWEGDLIIGARNATAIGTLVERTTRYLLLVHLPDGYTAEAARDGLIATIGALPRELRRSLTWDQGGELARHAEIRCATDMDIYFCDPGKPWQRGSNENTNGLLRQYFAKGTDLKLHDAAELQRVAAELNSRPRKTLGWATPAARLNYLLSTTTTG